MEWWHQIRAAFQFVFRRRAVERQIEDELSAFLEHRAEALEKQGINSTSAREIARAEFGGVDQAKENIREVFPAGLATDSIAKDLQYAWRMARRSPGFTAVAVLTLALGIGGTSAIFSVVKTVLLDPLPYGNPGRLVLIWNEFRAQGVTRAPGSGFELQQVRERAASFSGVGAIWAGNGNFTGDDLPEQVKIGFVTENFFDVLGRKPLLGRTFEPKDASAKGQGYVVLSCGLWQRRFGSDPAIVGKGVRFESGTVTVAGVMPADFRMVFPPDAQVPAEIQAWLPFGGNIYGGPRDLYYLRYVARLKSGVSLAQASQDVAALSQRLNSEIKEFGEGQLSLSVVPMQRDAVREIRPALLALFAGIGLVLLIACVNVANLLLARAVARQKEIALRTALGATRGRIVRQLLTESIVLAAAGGIAGLAIGWASLRQLAALAPAGLLPPESLSLDLRMVTFAAIVTLGAGILFGLAPARNALKLNIIPALQETGHGAATASRRASRAPFIVSEVALGVVLLAGAGLMIRTFIALLHVDPGFRPQGALTFEINTPGRRYPKDENRLAFLRECEQKLREIPGVEAAGEISHLPLDDYPNWYSPYAPEGLAEEKKSAQMADHRAASPGYFRAIGAQLLAGRFYDEMDESAQRAVVVVDERLAEEAWPGESAVGKRISVEHMVEGAFINSPAEVVGVIRHVRHHGLARQVRGQVYIPFAQSARPHMSFVVRTQGDPLALVTAVRHAIAAIDKNLALAKIRPMEQYVDRALSAPRFTMVLAAIFGGLALLLAAVGVYGVAAQSVSQRTREFGVRMALGAQRTDILRMVLREGLVLAAGGTAIGCAGGLVLSQFLRSLLFGVGPGDPAVFAVAATVLPSTALLACWLPARRAAGLNPVQALRVE